MSESLKRLPIGEPGQFISQGGITESPIEKARARVVEAAKAWANLDTSNDDDELVMLADAVAELERLEADAQS